MSTAFKRIRTPYIILFMVSSWAYAQNQEPLNSDRPDQSDGTYTLTKNSYQLENGFSFTDDDKDYYAHEYMLRYGLTPTTELRFIAEFGSEQGDWKLNPLGLSVKQALVQNEGIRPAITAVGYLYIPGTASLDNKPKELPLSVLLAFENELSPRLSLGYNIGLAYDGDDYDENWVSTAALSYSLSKKVDFFVEYYGSYKKDDDPLDDDYENGFDGGILWGINPNFQLDMAIGKALNEPDEFTLTVGLSYRFQ